MKARESGILVLPDGASREDLISTTRIREYVQRHALEWYIFLNSRSRRLPFPNGSIYVVTGYDKASTWAISTSGSRIGSRANEPKTIQYQNRQWIKASRGMGAKVSNASQDNGKCALFVRGMRVAVSIRDWTTCILNDQPPAITHFYHILSVPVTGFRARLQTLMETRSSYEEMSVRPQAREVRGLFVNAYNLELIYISADISSHGGHSACAFGRGMSLPAPMNHYRRA